MIKSYLSLFEEKEKNYQPNEEENLTKYFIANSLGFKK